MLCINVWHYYQKGGETGETYAQNKRRRDLCIIIKREELRRRKNCIYTQYDIMSYMICTLYGGDMCKCIYIRFTKKFFEKSKSTCQYWLKVFLSLMSKGEIVGIKL